MKLYLPTGCCPGWNSIITHSGRNDENDVLHLLRIKLSPYLEYLTGSVQIYVYIFNSIGVREPMLTCADYSAISVC